MINVSVIVPVYNEEKYIKKCLDSLCNQSLEDIEIICINDGSTDSTHSILEYYSNKYEHLKIINTENKGQGAARNTALEIAKGEYISFVDADDWIDLSSLELSYNKAHSNDLDMLFFQMINYLDESRKFVETDLYNHKCFIDNFYSENVFNYSDVDNIFEIPVCPVSKLYKKDFLIMNKLKFSEENLFEDNSFFYDSFFKCNRAGFIKKHLYYRRRHANSVTQTLDESKFDIVVAANDVLNVFLKNNKYYDYKNKLVNHTMNMILEWFDKSPLELKQNFYIFIKREFKVFNDLSHDFENNLNDNNLLVYNIFCKNEYYIDFLAEYKLISSDYTIYGNNPSHSNIDTNKSFKISVIIPIYNSEEFIHRTLMSIENQTMDIDDIEVIMINDSSNDNTYNIINKYAEKHNGFKAIHISESTGSPGTPRNIGLMESSGEYVIFLDHDDFFEINALETLYNCIVSADSDVVYGTYVSIDEDVPTKIIYPNEKHGFFKNLSENERCIGFPPPSIWTKLFKRSFLIENNILFPTILGEDAIFMSKVLINADGIYYLWNSVICYHVLNKKSHTNSRSYKYFVEGFESERYMADFYKSYNNDYYKIRGEGILDFYLNQFYKSNLTKDEIIKLFPLLYGFVIRLNSYGLTPHVSENNLMLFNYVINKDINSIFEIKNLAQKDVRYNIKFKNFIKSLLKKIIR